MRTVRAHPNENLPESMMGRNIDEDNFLMKWSPRSPYLPPCDFLLWGYIKGLAYVLPLPAGIDELKQGITFELVNITGNMLQRVWLQINF